MTVWQNNLMGPVVFGKVGYVGCQETNVSHHRTLSSPPYLHEEVCFVKQKTNSAFSTQVVCITELCMAMCEDNKAGLTVFFLYKY